MLMASKRNNYRMMTFWRLLMTCSRPHRNWWQLFDMSQSSCSLQKVSILSHSNWQTSQGKFLETLWGLRGDLPWPLEEHIPTDPRLKLALLVWSKVLCSSNINLTPQRLSLVTTIILQTHAWPSNNHLRFRWGLAKLLHLSENLWGHCVVWPELYCYWWIKMYTKRCIATG